VSFGGRIKRGPMAADVFEKQFTQIYNGLFRDPRLSFKAKGIFGLISTHRDGFGVSLESIAACATDGVAGVRTGLLELIEFQYLQRDRVRDDLGRLGEAVYFITDMPDGLIILMNPDWDTPEVQTGRSEPRCDSPTLAEPNLAEPTLDDRTHKKTNHQKTSGKNIKDVALRAEGAPGRRRQSTGSSPREAAGGSAAPGKSKPGRLTKQQNAAVDAVFALLPEALRTSVPRRARGLPQAILEALGAGEPWERTPEQLVQYRVMPRWDLHWASEYYAGKLPTAPIGPLRAMLKRDQLCNDFRCDEHVEVDSGQPCRSCEGKRLNNRGDKAARGNPDQGSETPRPEAGKPPAPAEVPGQRPAPTGWPRCAKCRNPMQTVNQKLCRDCQEDARYDALV
jgi:hypothetical protein